MSKCTKCGRESDNFRLCTSCKKDWKTRRLQAYEIVERELGEQTPENRKEFNNRLRELENTF